MKLNSRLALFVVAVLFAAVEMKAQESSAVRPRTVTATAQVKQTPSQTSAQTSAEPTAPRITAPLPKPAESTSGSPIIEPEAQKKIAGPVTNLTPSVVQARISEARRMLKTRPVP